MMRPSVKLGRLFGVDIGLHYSWLIIAFLIVFSLSVRLRLADPEWTSPMIWSVSAIIALLFFVSILVHELSHALVAKSRGMSVRSITLFALGGVANIEDESTDPKSEFWTAIVGPITSFLIGLLFWGIARIVSGTPTGDLTSPISVGLMWLGYINIALAVFNMIPGYPLDGGRVLRSIVWRFNHDAVRATEIAARVGQLVAAIFILLGVFSFFTRANFGGLWIAFIGWFLWDAARASFLEVQMSTALSGLRVSELMLSGCSSVDGGMSVRTFAEKYLLRTGLRCCVVRRDGHEEGVVTIREIRTVERERWPFTTLSQIAVPFDQVSAVSPESTVEQALKRMVKENVSQLPVLAEGKIAGVISRESIIQFLQMRGQLRAA